MYPIAHERSNVWPIRWQIPLSQFAGRRRPSYRLIRAVAQAGQKVNVRFGANWLARLNFRCWPKGEIQFA